MTDDKKDKATLSAERARQIILKRRARFVAAALAGIGGLGCDAGPQVCLSIVVPERDAGNPRMKDGGARVCLSVLRDSGPRVCLSPPQPRCDDPYVEDLYDECPEDAGVGDGGETEPDSQDGGKRGIDAGPQVCLSVVTLRDDPRTDEPEAVEKKS